MTKRELLEALACVPDGTPVYASGTDPLVAYRPAENAADGEGAVVIDSDDADDCFVEANGWTFLYGGPRNDDDGGSDGDVMSEGPLLFTITESSAVLIPKDPTITGEAATLATRMCAAVDEARDRFGGDPAVYRQAIGELPTEYISRLTQALRHTLKWCEREVYEPWYAEFCEIGWAELERRGAIPAAAQDAAQPGPSPLDDL